MHNNNTVIMIILVAELIATSRILFPGQTAEFRCRVEGSPPPTVEWSKGKWRKMTNDQKTRVFFDDESQEYVLEMDEIKKADTGTYTVTIQNKFGSESCPATLMVTDKEEDVQDWKSQLKKT